MSDPAALIDPAFALYELADVAGRYGTLIAIVIGVIGWATASDNPQRLARFRGMAIGGTFGYLLIISVDVIYEVLRFILGTEFLPSDWPYGVITGTGLNDLTLLSTALSGVLHSLGLAVFIVGVTLWAFGKPGSMAGTGGRRATTMGLVLVGASIGGNVVGVFAGVIL
ncbi:hypothetical protein [Halosimplex halobium]|uniref:hypothetical protein n=1 Tax=Halosimplex halobium TaxID=3396618 RepID=UPI003F54B523